MDLPHDLFQACLSPTDSSTPVRFQVAIAKAAGAWHVEACDADVDDYVHLGLCTREMLPLPTPVTVSRWGGPDHDHVHTAVEEGFWRVSWNDETLYLVEAEWTIGYGKQSRSWVVARDRKTALAFILDVARKTNEPRESMLVFHGSCWQKSRELYAQVQRSSFDDLILASSLKARIREDFQRFLKSRTAYEEHGLAWRRGALFLGPPGNGKTHCLRALVKELGVPSLYVQSVKTRYETEEANLKRVFERARQLRPCVLVLEDLDALVTNDNRSFFLNQLDGFEKNVGMIVLATTNHPERIDPAILERPSRFDRKYHFDLPEIAERGAYLDLWKTKLASKVEWSDSTTRAIAEKTSGFSFAYLKELLTTALMRSVSGETGFDSILTTECDALIEQMKTGAKAKNGGATAPTSMATDLDDGYE